MAQWLGQFTGRTHKTAVADAEQLLEHAVAVFNDASSNDRAKKAKTVRSLAKRLLLARARFLRAGIAAIADPATAEVLDEHARQIARLQDTLAAVTRGGVEAIIQEFSGLRAREILAAAAFAGSQGHLNNAVPLAQQEHENPRFERWLPFGDSVTKVVIEGLSEVGDDDFSLLLRPIGDTAALLVLSWPRRPHAYRNIDESYRLSLWQSFTTAGHAFWTARDSLWLREFHRDSAGACEGASLIHYAVYTGDDCVDVISSVAPVAERRVADR